MPRISVCERLFDHHETILRFLYQPASCKKLKARCSFPPTAYGHLAALPVMKPGSNPAKLHNEPKEPPPIQRVLLSERRSKTMDGLKLWEGQSSYRAVNVHLEL